MHRMIEALHLTFADGFNFIADGTPKEVVEAKLGQDYANGIRDLIKNDEYVFFMWPHLSNGEKKL